jgi:hypothetical protein
MLAVNTFQFPVRVCQNITLFPFEKPFGVSKTASMVRQFALNPNLAAIVETNNLTR